MTKVVIVLDRNADIPEGWALARLGDLVQPSKEKIDPQRVPDLPYLSLEHIQANSRRIVGHAAARKATSTKAVFRPGDVLYGKLRPYLNKVCRPDFEGVCSTDILVFSQRPELDSRYLLYFLNRQEVVDATTHAMAGVNLPRVSFKTLAELEFPLPPLAEQRRIADRLDALFRTAGIVRDRLATLVEDRKEGEREISSILKRFRQAVLAAACSGRLTEGWREAEALTAIGSEEAAATSEDLRELPIGWRWRALGSMGEDPRNPVQTGPFGAQLHNNEFVEDGIPVVAVGNLTGMGFTEEGLYYITSEKAKQLARYSVDAGDVLFARSGATLGKVCVAPHKARGWRMTGHILRVRLDRQQLLPELAVYALRGDPDVVNQVQAGVRGVTRPGYNTSLLESVQVPVPPIDEQCEIVRRVEALFTLATKIEACTRTTAARAEKLTQAILSKAFSGELVPIEAELARAYGRTYETAVALLDRIATSVLTDDTPKRRRNRRRRT